MINNNFIAVSNICQPRTLNKLGEKIRVEALLGVHIYDCGIYVPLGV